MLAKLTEIIICNYVICWKIMVLKKIKGYFPPNFQIQKSERSHIHHSQCPNIPTTCTFWCSFPTSPWFDFHRTVLLRLLGTDVCIPYHVLIMQRSVPECDSGSESWPCGLGVLTEHSRVRITGSKPILPPSPQDFGQVTDFQGQEPSSIKARVWER